MYCIMYKYVLITVNKISSIIHKYQVILWYQSKAEKQLKDPKTLAAQLSSPLKFSLPLLLSNPTQP